MNPSVSVIIPVYNTQKYLNECLDSVFNQTMIDDIEVIVIDDGSTDKCDDIIKKYLTNHNNLRHVRQINSGLATTRNNGLKMAKGEYILFLDSDDYIAKNCIECLYDKAKINNADVVIMGHNKVYLESNYIRFDEYIIGADENKIYNGKDVCDMMLNSKVLGYACDKFFKRVELANNKFEFESGRYIEDLFPIFKYVYNCKNIVFCNEALYFYRQRNTSISNTKNKKLLEDYIYATECVIDYIEKNKCIFNKNSMFNFYTSSFNNIISIYSGYNKNINMYKKFYKNGFCKYEPNLIRLIQSKNLKYTTKISIFLWKLRVYSFIMPTLKNIKNNILDRRKSTVYEN